MNPVAIVNDEHLSGETEHPQSLRYLRPEDQRILVVDDEEVILDLILPDANGLSLYRTIARRRPELAGRVIFVTGALQGAEAGRFMRPVDNHVLLKPFEPAEVVRAVRAVMSRPGG